MRRAWRSGVRGDSDDMDDEVISWWCRDLIVVRARSIAGDFKGRTADESAHLYVAVGPRSSLFRTHGWVL